MRSTLAQLLIIGYALSFATLTALPYGVAAASTPAGAVYSGALPVPSGFQVDYNSHMAKMWQGAHGQWHYRLLFTHEPHPGLPGVQGFYVALGALAATSGLSFAVIYQAARSIAAAALVLLLWQFAGRFFAAAWLRWLVVLFGTVMMGSGWLLFLVAPQMTQQVAPIEFWLSDAYHFTGVLYMPHFGAAICAQMVAVLALLGWLRRPRAMPLLILTLALSAMSWIQPYVVLLTFPLFGGVALWCWWHDWRSGQHLPVRVLALFIPAALHGGMALWQYAAIVSHPIWRSFSDQNITLSPPPLYYLLGYLPLLLPVAAGLWQAWRQERSMLPFLPPAERRMLWLIPLLWVLLVVLLVYAPTATQRRYLLGVQTPLAVLAAAGWAALIRPLPSARARLATLLLILWGSLAPLLVLLANSAPAPGSPIYYTADEAAAYAWLRENAPPDALVLTTLDGAGSGSGGRLVAMTGRRVFIGHWIETANFAAKVAQLHQFYDPQTSDEWRQALLAEAGVAYVWYDEYARAYGPWSPDAAPYLALAYTQGSLQIYRVVSSPGSAR